jgi:CcmD family protein
MMYLFWSFAVVWIALFAYVRGLMRRTHALEDEVHRLAHGLADARTPQEMKDPPAPAGAGPGPADLRPARRDAPSPGQAIP